MMDETCSDEQPAIVARMRDISRQWDETADQRAIFLSCYAMMTANMLAAVDGREFDDPPWVDHLLHRFADYYFEALAAYDMDPAAAPRVWQMAHDTCRDAKVWPLQKLLLGINAHINYDLALTLDELLRAEWPELAETRRAGRKHDYLIVNDIIGRTVDAVQDQVLEPAMPVMAYLDVVLGPADEFLLSRLLYRWRDRVWAYAVQLLGASDLTEREAVIRQMEADALQRAAAIRMADGPLSIWALVK